MARRWDIVHQTYPKKWSFPKWKQPLFEHTTEATISKKETVDNIETFDFLLLQQEKQQNFTPYKLKNHIVGSQKDEKKDNLVREYVNYRNILNSFQEKSVSL